MLDVIYLRATAGFFAAILAYVHGCEALGREAGEAEGPR
jgi:hypothetical protein